MKTSSKRACLFLCGQKEEVKLVIKVVGSHVCLDIKGINVV